MIKRTIIQIICVVLISSVVFFSVAFLLSREQLLGVDVPKTDVPYINGKYMPENATILIAFENGRGVVVELSFSLGIVNAVLLSNATKEEAMSFGFNINHTVNCDYTFLAKFIDSLGGIPSPEENFILTGVQVCDFIKSAQTTDKEHYIVSSVFEKISKYGFSTDSLYCIINNTNTTLSAPACYGWCESLKDICVSYNIIDGRKTNE